MTGMADPFLAAIWAQHANQAAALGAHSDWASVLGANSDWAAALGASRDWAAPLVASTDWQATPLAASTEWSAPPQVAAPLAAGSSSDLQRTEAPAEPSGESRQQRMKAQREADVQEAEQTRCHLHKRPKEGCRFCQRYKEYVTRKEEEKAAMRDRFLSKVGRQGRSRADDAGDLHGRLEPANPKTFGFPPLLQSHIVESTHFKTLMELAHFEDIVEELRNFADTVEPYLQNSSSVPSALFCCVYRLLTMGIDGQQLRQLLESDEGAFTRCAGFLFVRFGLGPEQLWTWCGEYVLDDEEMRPSKDAERGTTIGEFVESLLMQERYYSTVLPRLPMSIKRQLEVHLAPVAQYRKRTAANQRLLELYRKRGVRVEACCEDGEWRGGEVLELLEAAPSRIKVRVRLADGADASIPLGKVILADGGGSRGRSQTMDWSRHKGKSGTELVEELRRREQDRAVCSSKSEYARRPVSFKVALPMEQGSASHRLIQDETAVPAAKQRVERERSRSPAPRGREHSAEYQARMRQLFEKYGMAKGAEADAQRSRNDIEGPDVMRLG